MQRTLTSLLVGMHFRPPAKVLLAHLASGCPLMLQPEPDNAYDDKALQVLLDPANILESQHSALANPHSGLESQGATLEQVLSSGLIHLGYVAKSGGAPLLKAETASGGQLRLVGNAEFLEAMAQGDLELNEAKLGFGPSGEPLVMLKVDEPEEDLEPEEDEDEDEEG